MAGVRRTGCCGQAGDAALHISSDHVPCWRQHRRRGKQGRPRALRPCDAEDDGRRAAPVPLQHPYMVESFHPTWCVRSSWQYICACSDAPRR